MRSAQSTLALLLVLSAAGIGFAQTPAAQAQNAPTLPATPATCEADLRILADTAIQTVRRAEEHNRLAREHAERYKREMAICEIARKSNTKPELEACLTLLDKAEARAQHGNQLAAALAKDTESLRVRTARHNKRCPLLQLQLLSR
jgi:hypothetical protein